MSITVLQKPYGFTPAQSPIVFSVLESVSNNITASEFQYTANLYVWSGTYSQSGSYLYQARKYPNPSGSGIFDFSRMINSTLTEPLYDNGSNVKYYKVDFGWQYASGSSYVTQSGALTSVSSSENGGLFQAYDGYDTFASAGDFNLFSSNNGNINTDFLLMSIGRNYPILSNMNFVTQSVLLTDVSRLQGISGDNGRRGLSILRDLSEYGVPTPLSCSLSLTASYENGTTSFASQSFMSLIKPATSESIIHFPCAPGDADWNTYYPGVATASLDSYVFNLSVPTFTTFYPVKSFNFKVVCSHYYTPVRIAYKNMFGQFDFLNFYKRQNNTFNTEQRLFQPQMGTWEKSTLTVGVASTNNQRYIVDASQVLECNTDWLSDGYNEMMKQLLVSDEIYQIVSPSSLTGQKGSALAYPLTIQTNSLQFKTGVNNKLIQYTIAFNIGKSYKLII
jgi:hypothetical protein